MGSATALSVGEYLHTSFPDLDREYRDGEIVDRAWPDYVHGPPLVAIEILSPDHRLGEVREKLEDYRTWGVPHVWLVDPRSRRFYTCDAGLTEAPSLTVPELGIEITQYGLFKSFR